jgi:prophage maintenance system killer protein
MIFLEINGVSIEASYEELVDLVLKTTAGQFGKKEIADFFRLHGK